MGGHGARISAPLHHHFDRARVLPYRAITMICQSCQVNPATGDFTQIVDGETKKLQLCAECAAEKKIDVHGPLSLTDILFGLGDNQEQAPSATEETCPHCHMRKSDFRKTSQFGCPACYETFAGELEPMFRSMHRDVRHVGKVPAAARLGVELESMQRQLDEAVERQDFEEAARLRDAVRELRSAGSVDAG